MKAKWNNRIIAQSNETVHLEGNHYFPKDSVKWEYFTETDLTTTCPWKGEARYYTIEVDGEVNQDGAWSYPEPKEAAQEIRGYVAFYNTVEITE